MIHKRDPRKFSLAGLEAHNFSGLTLLWALFLFFSACVPLSFNQSGGTPAPGDADSSRGVGVVAATGAGVGTNSIGPEKRLALVIGNGAYSEFPLRNPVNDAQDMARVLGALGFEVIHEANANKRKLVEAIDTFGQKLPKADIGLFYFAGHGVQVDGRNYLIPVGAHVTVERDVEFEAVAAERVLGQMEAAGNRVNIVMLDACRNNPYARSYRSAAQGLARMDAPKGSYVVFATSPGATAADGQGRNGLFTGNLLKYIQTPGLKLEEVIKRTRADVVQASGDKQLPWDSSSLTGDFFFVQTTAAMTPSIVQPTPGAPLPPTPGAPGSIPDLTQTIKAREEAEKKWTGWQKKMDAEFAKAKGYDANARLKAEEKAQVWTAFLAAFSDDNPHSAQDEGLRAQAKDRQTHWLGLTQTATVSFSPSTAEPAPSPAGSMPPQVAAMLDQAIGYFIGTAGYVDEPKARTLLLQAVQSGHPIPKMLLAELLFSGARGFEKDQAKGEALARETYQSVNRLALSGDPTAMFLIGDAYSDGLVVGQDFNQAMAWYRKAADQGHVFATNSIGYLYGNGLGVPLDYHQARAWYQKAADRGDARAMFNIGIFYMIGHGVLQDYAQAMGWFRKAADRGIVGAMVNIGNLYHNGYGVSRDYNQAMVWFRKAADRGNGNAMFNIGVLYEHGQGVTKDLAQAVTWFRQAAAKGSQDAPEKLKELGY